MRESGVGSRQLRVVAVRPVAAAVRVPGEAAAAVPAAGEVVACSAWVADGVTDEWGRGCWWSTGRRRVVWQSICCCRCTR